MRWMDMAADRDAELKAALARDLNAGFEALVHAYQHRLYAFALSMSPRAACAAVRKCSICAQICASWTFAAM